jgi:hypothetical protein
VSWLLNLGWVLWAVSAAVYLIERQRGADRRAAEHARVQALCPEELRDADFHVLLTGKAPSPDSVEADHEERQYAIVVLVGLVLLAAAQGLAGFSS